MALVTLARLTLPLLPICCWCLLSQAETRSLPRPGVSADADKLLGLVNGLAGKQADKVEVDEGLLRKFASGALMCVVQ
jgi:hypothetical protein